MPLLHLTLAKPSGTVQILGNLPAQPITLKGYSWFCIPFEHSRELLVNLNFLNEVDLNSNSKHSRIGLPIFTEYTKSGYRTTDFSFLLSQSVPKSIRYNIYDADSGKLVETDPLDTFKLSLYFTYNRNILY